MVPSTSIEYITREIQSLDRFYQENSNLIEKTKNNEDDIKRLKEEKNELEWKRYTEIESCIKK